MGKVHVSHGIVPVHHDYRPHINQTWPSMKRALPFLGGNEAAPNLNPLNKAILFNGESELTDRCWDMWLNDTRIIHPFDSIEKIRLKG